jgi:protease PrsW
MSDVVDRLGARSRAVSAVASLAQPRWGFQTGILQPRQPAFWLYLVLLLGAGLFVGLIQIVYAATVPTGWALSWGLLVLYIVPVVLLVRWLDLYEREPRSLLIGAFLWGGVIAVTFASFANVAWGTVIARLAGGEFASEWSAALTAPVIEESYKILGVVTLYLIARPEMDDLMDGFVLGAMVGLGFAAVEDVDYFINAFGGSVSGVLEGFWVRIIASGLYGHVLYTGLSGIGFAYFVTRRAEASFGRRLVVALGLLLLAMAAHFVWNSPFLWDLPLLVATAVKGLPFLLILVIALRLARRREHRWLGAALEKEVGGPGVLDDEFDDLRDPRRRRAARRAVTKAAGREAGRVLKDLHREQIALSMIATRVARPDDPELIRQRNKIRALRERLWSIPGVTPALGISASNVEAVRSMPEEVPWEPNAVAPLSGLAAWTEPDGTTPAAGRIEPGTALVVVQRTGDWAQVRAINGWTGWVDGRLMAQPRRSFWR